MNFGLKMKFEKEKEKKEISTGHPFSPGGPSTLSAPAHLTPSPFLFPRGADDRGPPVSLSPSPFLSSSPRCPAGRRDGRGHQWQAPPLGVRPSPLAFLPLALFKLAHEPLRLPLPLQHPSTRARAPISPRRRLGFPPPPSIRRRR
jgi:hypothetical protein